jgi:hypothetical protein
VLVGVAVVTAAAAGAPLLYDGAWFFYSTVNNRQIEIPQARITFGLLLWPVVVASHHTDRVEVLRLAFGLPLTIAPLVTLGAAWWVVRRTRPALFVWATLGILLVNLPGQTHWVATSLRTNQLVWPILLAVLVGLPDRTLPLVAVLLLAVVNLHPQAAVYLLFVAAVCGLLAWREPDLRHRFLGAATVFAAFAVYRAGVIAPGYEVDQASAGNQVSQWRDSVLGWPLVFLAMTFTIAGLLVWCRAHPTARRAAGPVTMVAGLVGAAAMVRWASDPDQWREAIQYRGPSLFHGLAMMSVAVVDRILAPTDSPDRSAATTAVRLRVANVGAAVFCVVIVMQAVTVRGERKALADDLATRPAGCVPYSDLPELRGSPLDFWSTPALSLLLGGSRPERILLPDDHCREAVATGDIPLTTLDNDDLVRDRHLDHRGLFAGLERQHPCRIHFGAGWGELEQTPAGTLRRLTSTTGRLEIDLAEPAVLALRGTLWSPEHPNEVQLRVDGSPPTVLTFEPAGFTPLTGRALALEAGTHVVELVDGLGGSDGSVRSVAALDLGASIHDGSTACRVSS